MIGMAGRWVEDWEATRAETRYGCFLPDLTGLARSSSVPAFRGFYIGGMGRNARGVRFFSRSIPCSPGPRGRGNDEYGTGFQDQSSSSRTRGPGDGGHRSRGNQPPVGSSRSPLRSSQYWIAAEWSLPGWASLNSFQMPVSSFRIGMS